MRYPEKLSLGFVATTEDLVARDASPSLPTCPRGIAGMAGTQ